MLLNPYEGLKLTLLDKRCDRIERGVEMLLNPYEGLKHSSGTNKPLTSG